MTDMTIDQLQKKIALALRAYAKAARARRAADGDLANDRFLDTEELCELRLTLAKADRLVERRGLALDRLEANLVNLQAAAKAADALAGFRAMLAAI